MNFLVKNYKVSIINCPKNLAGADFWMHPGELTFPLSLMGSLRLFGI
jgi:hypothetical protein